MKILAKAIRYLVTPEDTTTTSGEMEANTPFNTHDLPPCLYLIKGIFWIIIAVVIPLMIPVISRLVAE